MILATETPSIDCIHLVKSEHYYARDLESDVNKRRYGSTTYEMIYRISGADKIRVGDEHFLAGAGSIEILPPKDDTAIMTQTVESGNYINIFFTSSKPFVNHLIVFDASRNPNLGTLFSKICSVWEHKKEGYYLKALYLFYQLLYEIEQCENQRYLSHNQYAKIEPGVEYIQTNYLKNSFSHKTPSDICGVSYTYFQRLFQKKFKTTPVKYVTKLRMKTALDMLFTGEYTIEQIAKAVGYKNAYYFSRVFKETYGCPPSKYIH